MNYYQFHIADFALHTSHLTLEEEAVYRRLLDFYYDTEAPIPKETESVIRRLRLGSYEKTVGSILDEFFVLQGDGWHNLRADAEIAAYNLKAETARENGKRGGRPKKNKDLKSKNPEKPSGLEIGTQKKANQEPRTKNQEPNRGRFKPPSVEEVSEYCRERGNGIDPSAFVDFYTANGWVQSGGKKIKDWKACVRTWENRRRQDNGSGGADLRGPGI